MHDLVGIKKLMRARSAQPTITEDGSPTIPIKRRQRQKRLLLALGIPVTILLVYFYGVGRNRYFVSSDVVVRKANESSPSTLSLNTLLGGGNQQSLEDARYLRTYLESPQVLEDMDKIFNFRKAYAKKWPDVYPGVNQDDSREKVYETFRKQISVSLNESSGELTIRTLAFDPYTALRFNQYLINQAELFVNRLNQDVYRQQLDFTQKQVELNAQRVQQASQSLQVFQRDNQVLDAKTEAQGSESFIATLEGELAKQRVQLATLRRQFKEPNAPEVEAVESEVQELQRQIKKERSGLVSPSGKNLNEKAARQAELEARLAFATDLYKASLTAAEKTRVDSLQQQRFMAVLSKPLMPEEPWQYWRHKGFFTGLAVLIVGFALTKFLLGMADSHRN